MKVSRERINAAAAGTCRHTTEELKKNCDAGACTTICGRLNGVIEAEFAAAKGSGAAVACAPGCSYCCHLRVGAFAHEAIALLKHLRTRVAAAEAAAIEQRILENAQRIDGMTVREHYAANIPCAFLVAGQCSAYEVRPAECASYHSTSRERCQYSFEHPSDMGTPKNGRPALLGLQVFGNALHEAIQAGLKDAGLSTGKGELHQLLRALIKDPSVVERWRAGGNIAGAEIAAEAMRG
jgi:hypothetical protein